MGDVPEQSGLKSMSAQDETRYMQRAISLALRAEGYTSPNPMVGCVLVKEGRIVGEGFHVAPGKAHAEAAALRVAGDDARGATAYVTLEPCNHQGRTPPCAQALIKAGIAEVVYAVADPNPVAKGGATTLKEAGIPVRKGLCESDAQNLIRFWLAQFHAARPYMIAKYAASLDGRTATHTGESKWITSEAARQRGHDLRQACDAIIVGVETILADDPSLTARPSRRAGRQDANHPLRVILDTKGRAPLEAKVFRATTPGKTLLATSKSMPGLKQAQLQKRGIDVVVLPTTSKGHLDLTALMKALRERHILSAMIEGGGTVLGSFFEAGLVDEVWAFIAPLIISGGRPAINGDGPALLSDAFKLENTQIEQLGTDILMRGQLARNIPLPTATSMEA